jgi:5'-nucleotidase / UDP-sugar diphosphatase
MTSARSACALLFVLACSRGEDAPPGSVRLTILHTNDLHSHLTGSAPEIDYTPATVGDDATVGGLARLAARIKAARGADPVILVDAGDFMMGTPFQALGQTEAAEIVELGKLGYDAITLGNHELDWGPSGLAGILGAAMSRGFKVPIVATNMVFSAADAADDRLAAFESSGVIRRKVIKDVGGLRVGIFGLLGEGASELAPFKKPLTFGDILVAARATVMELRQVDKADVVIALSHSGVDAMGNGEDRKLADDGMVKAAGGIDVIVSGHTHDRLMTPIKTGNTWIVQAGAYGRWLGKLDLSASKTDAGTTLSLVKYELQKIDDSIAGDPATQAAVEGYVTAVDTLLRPRGYLYRNVAGETTVDVGAVPYEESGIGDLVTDAYLNMARSLLSADPPVLAIDAAGDIRDDIKKGKTGHIWFSDAFRVQSLGIGPDNQPGYPIVTFLVNGKDLKAAFELSAAAKTLGKPDYFLQVSGATVSWQESAPAFNRVTSIKVGDTNVSFTDTAKCYKLVTNLYVANLLGVVERASGGMQAVVPKGDDCRTSISDLTTRIVDRNPATPQMDELKEWQALVTYIYALPDPDGNTIPNVPPAYASAAVPPRNAVAR